MFSLYSLEYIILQPQMYIHSLYNGFFFINNSD